MEKGWANACTCARAHPPESRISPRRGITLTASGDTSTDHGRAIARPQRGCADQGGGVMAKPSIARVGRNDAKSVWRKSSYSGSNGDCVELAQLGHVVGVRDSKDHQGAVVSVNRRTMTTFVAALVSGHLTADRY
ncbi:DUF397 domain-containing protein [Streptomyces sp. NPDC057521]|uniref:DUF397 domain-containing protein n=1 Tax=Streptomyces sp. NPDC057521 TaxID=3346156 RepID=UPI003682BF16